MMMHWQLEVESDAPSSGAGAGAGAGGGAGGGDAGQSLAESAWQRRFMHWFRSLQGWAPVKAGDEAAELLKESTFGQF